MPERCRALIRPAVTRRQLRSAGSMRAPNVASGWGTPDLATPVRAVTRSGVDALRDEGDRSNELFKERRASRSRSQSSTQRRLAARVPNGYISLRMTDHPAAATTLDRLKPRAFDDRSMPLIFPVAGSHPGGRRFEPG
jgi:hypothetical protein